MTKKYLFILLLPRIPSLCQLPPRNFDDSPASPSAHLRHIWIDCHQWNWPHILMGLPYSYSHECIVQKRDVRVTRAWSRRRLVTSKNQSTQDHGTPHHRHHDGQYLHNWEEIDHPIAAATNPQSPNTIILCPGSAASPLFSSLFWLVVPQTLESHISSNHSSY